MWLSGRTIGRGGGRRRRLQLCKEQVDGVAGEDGIGAAQIAVGPVVPPEFQRNNESFYFVLAQCFEQHRRRFVVMKP
jgi:hypothetical protein